LRRKQRQGRGWRGHGCRANRDGAAGEVEKTVKTGRNVRLGRHRQSMVRVRRGIREREREREREGERDDFISKVIFSPGAQMHKYRKLNNFVIKILHDSSR